MGVGGVGVGMSICLYDAFVCRPQPGHVIYDMNNTEACYR